MSKAQIIAELAHLTPEDLADVRAWLNHVAPDTTTANTRPAAIPAARIRSPRLANPAQAHDFRKQVTELTAIF